MSIFFKLVLLLTVNFKNHTSVIIISKYIEFSSVSFLTVALFCINMRYFIFPLRFHHDYAQNFSQRSPHHCLKYMPQCMIVINLVNQVFSTAAHPTIAKDILWRFQFFPFCFLDIRMQKWKQKQCHKEK